MNHLPPGKRIALDDVHFVYAGDLPDPVRPAAVGSAFDALWALRTSRPEITLHGRLVETPRWQQAYIRDYEFSGKRSSALPLPRLLEQFVTWARGAVDPRLNGALVNWYAAPGDQIDDHRTARGGDYIGPHRDSREGLVVGAPIVTVSLGGLRVFRLRAYRTKSVAADIPLPHGTVVVLPFETNLAYTHEVPRPRATKSENGRRISITLRAFA